MDKNDQILALLVEMKKENDERFNKLDQRFDKMEEAAEKRFLLLEQDIKSVYEYMEKFYNRFSEIPDMKMMLLDHEFKLRKIS